MIAEILLTVPFSYAQAGLPSAIAFQKKQSLPLPLYNQKRNTQVSDVQMSLAPCGYTGYFSALSNFLEVGTKIRPVEDAMWKPEDFKTPWFYGMIYVLMVTMPASMTIYGVFGDQTLSHPSALKLFPKSKFRDKLKSSDGLLPSGHKRSIRIPSSLCGIVGLKTTTGRTTCRGIAILLLLHQAISFYSFPSWYGPHHLSFAVMRSIPSILSSPLYLFCEKFFKVQDSPSFTRRTLLRVPDMFLAIWLAALAFPFLQVSAPHAIFGACIIPWIAYIVIFWEKALSGVLQPAFPKLSWEKTFSINLKHYNLDGSDERTRIMGQHNSPHKTR
ncbi:hypothetical protein SELMODRAFT_404487 [Selaginella moellendorffii]|uniref:Uncharacterized protein n=1 Tax=Selaginella moellendorffii TaxID=88036 RepID=D8QVH7_SELML|nr:hypothetical protein SELMODRAFT_404487 [Selaginella moellendorffii]